MIYAARLGEIQRAQRLAPFGIGTVHGYGSRLEAEDRRRLMGMIEEHFVNKNFASKDNRERAIRCSDCSRSEGKIVEMALVRIGGVSGRARGPSSSSVWRKYRRFEIAPPFRKCP
jgi:hypothetical protein